MPKTVRKSRRPATPEPVIAIEADPVVGGEPSPESDPGSNDIGQAIDWVRRALNPFDVVTRKRIIRAANVFMK
jgi:hypothetical protein